MLCGALQLANDQARGALRVYAWARVPVLCLPRCNAAARGWEEDWSPVQASSRRAAREREGGLDAGRLVVQVRRAAADCCDLREGSGAGERRPGESTGVLTAQDSGGLNR